jgi:LCP family protein required for cell wall assembly
MPPTVSGGNRTWPPAYVAGANHGGPYADIPWISGILWKDPDVPDRPRRHRRTILRVIVVAELVVAMVTAATVVFAYNHLDSNIDQLPKIPHKVKKPEVTGPINILVMGSDTRDGVGNDIDGQTNDGARSDTTILLHLSADRQTAYGVSLPRDAMVDRPDCEVDGKTVPGGDPVIFNDAFAIGGPLCTVQQVEHLTGIYIDHTVVIDFNGFKDMVDAVRGVEVCIPKDVDDPAHDIFLDAGTRLVSGQEALNYVRERHVLSPNSDIGRMKRQQAFIASMVNRVMSANTLAMPTRLYDFLDAATQSIKLDKDLASISKLVDLASQFKHTDVTHIKFVTVPIEAYPDDINRLQFAPEADQLWKLIRKDQPLGKFAKGSISAGDKVGSPDGGSDGGSAEPDAAARMANGLCA